ncbi:MAG: winged helix-turn-helix transcriptional regulator [Synergistetes bacterium]|nr:winged helix-turn-helix transcriptional regulator [Synergistota bacterium]
MSAILEEKLVHRLSEALQVLAHPIRLKILILCLEEEKTTKQLREMLGISKPLLIAHIKKLVNMGFLSYRVEFDSKRIIVRKYYATNDFEVKVDKEVLRSMGG